MAFFFGSDFPIKKSYRLGEVALELLQQRMADINSLAFWSEAAARYQNDGRVQFELYNEPHNVTWSTWKSGGPTSDGYQAVGMQQLYDTVRATGAQNLRKVGAPVARSGFSVGKVVPNPVKK